MWREGGLLSVGETSRKDCGPQANDTRENIEAIELRDLTAWKSAGTGATNNGHSLPASPIAETAIAAECGVTGERGATGAAAAAASGGCCCCKRDHSHLRGVCVFSRRGAVGNDNTNVHVVMATEHEILRPPSFDQELLDSEDDDSDTIEDISGEGSSPIFINPDGSIDVDFSDNEAEELEDFISLLTEPTSSMAAWQTKIPDQYAVSGCKFSSPRRTWQRPVSLQPYTDDAETCNDEYDYEDEELEHAVEALERNDAYDDVFSRTDDLSPTENMNDYNTLVSRLIEDADNEPCSSHQMQPWQNKNRMSVYSHKYDLNQSDGLDNEHRLRGGATMSVTSPKSVSTPKNRANLPPCRFPTDTNIITQARKARNFRWGRTNLSLTSESMVPERILHANGDSNDVSSLASSVSALKPGKTEDYLDLTKQHQECKPTTETKNRKLPIVHCSGRRIVPAKTTLQKDNLGSQKCPHCSSDKLNERAVVKKNIGNNGKTDRIPLGPKKSISIEDSIVNLTKGATSREYQSADEHSNESESILPRRTSSAKRVTERLRLKLGLSSSYTRASAFDRPKTSKTSMKSVPTAIYRRRLFQHRTSPRRQAFSHTCNSITFTDTSNKILNQTTKDIVGAYAKGNPSAKSNNNNITKLDTLSDCGSTDSNPTSRAPRLACRRCTAGYKSQEGVFMCSTCSHMERIKNAFVLELYTDHWGATPLNLSDPQVATCYGIRMGAGVLPLVMIFIAVIMCWIGYVYMDANRGCEFDNPLRGSN